MVAVTAFLPFSPAACRSPLTRSFGARTGPRLSHRLISRTSNLCYHKCFHRNWKATGKVLCSQVKLENAIDDEACELVNGIDLILGEEDNIHAYLLKAVKNNNETGVLILSDIFGLEDSSTRDFAYRVACSGYNVLVPDLFRGNPWKKGLPDSEFQLWLTGQSPERVANDIATSAKWLIGEFEAAGISKKLGIIGFSSSGGHLIETLARDDAANFGTGVLFYGTPMNASLAKDIKVPVLFICGDSDSLCPVSEVREIEKNIRGSRTMIYYGRGHGFAHRPESPEEDDDAEDAFAIMRNWLHDNLAVSKECVR